MSEANTPEGTGPIGVHEATERLASFMDSAEAAPEEQDERPEEGEAPEPEDVEAQAESEEGEQSDDDEAEEGEIEESQEDDEGEPEDDSEEESDEGYLDIDGDRITLEEAKKGYLRQQDYTRKTQEIAEGRKELEQHFEALQVERQRYAERLAELAQQEVQEPDWDTLRETDPIEYMLQRDQWRDRNERRQALEAERQRIEEQTAKEQQQKLVKHLQREQERLIERLPEWRDEKTAKKERQEVADLLREVGWTDEELGQLYDHRAIVLARMALKSRRLQDKRDVVAKKAKGKPKVTKPGPRKESDSGQAALKKVKRTGSVEDAVAYLLS